MQDFVGQQIDRYRIIARAGMGGMAVVYRAYDTRLERDVALKLIRTEAIPAEQHERLMKRFEREAKSQARFMHRHIVPIYDYGEVNGSPYLVMSYIPGGTLKDRTGQPVHYTQAIRWLLPVADALDYAHKRGVVHRDVKPSNILFDEVDQPILTDFGIAKILETDEATLTGTGLGVGTPEYMAPEQWQGKVSEATDQYALGVVLYELLTGQKPFQADTPVAVAILQATEPLRKPSSLAPGIPETVEKLLYKTLANNPMDRYVDMMALKNALDTNFEIITIEAAIPPEIAKPTHTALLEKPIAKASSVAETVDVLEPTPEEVIKQPVLGEIDTHTEKPVREHRSLPSWLLWTVGLVPFIILFIVGTSLIGFGDRRNSPNDAVQTTEPVISLVNTPVTTSADILEATATETQSISTTYAEFNITTNTPTAEPVLGIGSTIVNPEDGVVMVYVPEGEFLMGSTDWGAWDDEKPERLVYLDAYWIYQHEVTNEKYRQCIEAGDCNQPGNTAYYEDSDFDDHPVMYVNWNDAAAYCQWAGGRLPTEAEWEKAARGTDGRKYPWGDKDPNCSLANFTGCVGGTAPVGSYPDGASPYGAMDMAGNVWEWVADWYEKDYYNLSPYDNPTGPDGGTVRVLRGGSWYNISRSLRVSYRHRSDPDSSGISYGFRCLHLP